MDPACVNCGRRTNRCKIGFKGILLDGWKCRKCGEELIPAGELVRYEILTGKRKSLIRKVTKSGDSLVVSIPKALVDEFKLKKGSKVYFTKERRSLKITPLPL